MKICSKADAQFEEERFSIAEIDNPQPVRACPRRKPRRILNAVTFGVLLSTAGISQAFDPGLAPSLGKPSIWDHVYPPAVESQSADADIKVEMDRKNNHAALHEEFYWQYQ